MRRVWIVGAGFSRSLGGPLLPDLLSLAAPRSLNAAFREIEGAHNFEEPKYEILLWLYSYGQKFKLGRMEQNKNYWHDVGEGEHLWDDAEQFLDYLDTAAVGSGSASRTRIHEIVRRCFSHRPGLWGFARLSDEELVRQFATSARQVIAGVCSAFLVGASPENGSERWSPYVQWLRQLGPDDTVVSFNYDCVLELISENCKAPLEVRLIGGERKGGGPQLIKLHGSVNWKLTSPKGPFEEPSAHDIIRIEHQSDLNFAVRCAPEHLALGTPGPRKLALSNWLEHLWREACNAIGEAEAVIFLGYRFPPTDAYSRKRLFDALWVNGNPYLALHAVLGPKLDDAVERLMKILRYSLVGKDRQVRPRDKPDAPSFAPQPGRHYFDLVHEPLLVEDFLSVVPIGVIGQPYRLQ